MASTINLKMKTTTLDCSNCFHHGSFPNEGGCIDFEFLAPIRSAEASAEADSFFPKSIYVRKEMCEVFQELVKSDRKQRQILIGSPGVGKSILLFLVALYRALRLNDDNDDNNKPVCFIRKTRDTQELTSVFFINKTKTDTDTDDKDGIVTVTVHYSRTVDPDEKVKNVLKHVLLEHGNIEPEDALSAVLSDKVLLFIDGLHQGDADLTIPHHYLSTSGGYNTPVGESARSSTLVVLGGWQKAALGNALEQTSNILDAAAFREETLEDIFHHTGGRIREAFEYDKAPKLWKAEKKSTIDRISKQEAILSLVDTKGSSDPQSPDRVRTMFRNEDGAYFGSAVQIVDSQYYARLLQDRVGLEDYYNAYVHAKKRGLSSAAGCHFEELLHELFRKRPNPIQSVLESTGTGAEGLAQLSKPLCYWIPSIPNFANIDAALVIKHLDGSVVVWCLQYTVSKEHGFNSRTFLIKFLRPLLKHFGFQHVSVSVKIVFVVPEDVYTKFKLPQDVADAGYEGTTEFADCSSVGAVAGLLERLEFIDKPVTFLDDHPTAQRARQA